jgi:Ca2+-binding EF-hand superfamily protein
MMPMMDKDKDGMISKAEAMEVFGRKFDAMSKGGKMTAKQFADFATAIGQGNLNP